jgi:hypothetical protein
MVSVHLYWLSVFRTHKQLRKIHYFILHTCLPEHLIHIKHTHRDSQVCVCVCVCVCVICAHLHTYTNTHTQQSKAIQHQCSSIYPQLGQVLTSLNHCRTVAADVHQAQRDSLIKYSLRLLTRTATLLRGSPKSI